MTPFKVTIHRFRNSAVLELEGGRQHIPADAARVLASELEKLAADIETNSFANSKYRQFTLKGEAYHGR